MVLSVTHRVAEFLEKDGFGLHSQETRGNDPKLSDSGLGARLCARRREVKARAVPGFMAGRTARD